MAHGTELSAWEETTGLARQPHQPTTFLRPWEGPDALAPAGNIDFVTVMTPCLALVGGTGMTREARTEWLMAARVALADVPHDLLQRGAKAAMASADHPSKIVPAILAEVKSAIEARRRNAAPGTPRETERPQNDPSYCTPEEAAKILARHGVGKNVAVSDRPWAPAEQTVGSGEPGRRPSREDYIRLFGIDPDAQREADAG